MKIKLNSKSLIRDRRSKMLFLSFFLSWFGIAMGATTFVSPAGTYGNPIMSVLCAVCLFTLVGLTLRIRRTRMESVVAG